jgi:NAD(P)-dependent dehydrogenase (short-subunit alcohol dehydrogenase family)
MTPPGRIAAAGRATLVAGGTGALGHAVLAALLEAGQPVVATWRQEDGRDAIQELFGRDRNLTMVHADVTDPASVEALVGGLPEVGAVVNLVGGYAGGRLVHETDPKAFEAMLQLNLLPTFLLARSMMPRLSAGGGTFVAVSSAAGLRPFPGAAGYVASKAALIALIQALDTEYRAAGVRCNVVVPSVIDTPANRRSQPAADHARWVSPAEIAQVVLFLLSAASTPISGAAVPVYGRG